MPNTEPDSVVTVVAAVIYHPQDGRVLLARRGEHQHQGGKWEFPGGKVQPGENLLRALARELQEELGIRCNAAQPLMTICHDYGDKKVELHFYAVHEWLGEANGCEGQKLEWEWVKQLPQRTFPAANRPLVNALMLGERWLFWPSEVPEHWQIRLHLALQRGISIVYVGEVVDSALLAQISAICQQHKASLLVGTNIDELADVAVDGVHLTVAEAQQRRSRLTALPLLSIACESADDLDAAIALDANMVTFPVAGQATVAEQRTAAWEAFHQQVAGRPCVVFARGGLGPSDLTRARMYGAWGVAGEEGFWPLDQLLH